MSLTVPHDRRRQAGLEEGEEGAVHLLAAFAQKGAREVVGRRLLGAARFDEILSNTLAEGHERASVGRPGRTRARRLLCRRGEFSSVAHARSGLMAAGAALTCRT